MVRLQIQMQSAQLPLPVWMVRRRWRKVGGYTKRCGTKIQGELLQLFQTEKACQEGVQRGSVHAGVTTPASTGREGLWVPSNNPRRPRCSTRRGCGPENFRGQHPRRVLLCGWCPSMGMQTRWNSVRWAQAWESSASQMCMCSGRAENWSVVRWTPRGPREGWLLIQCTSSIHTIPLPGAVEWVFFSKTRRPFAGKQLGGQKKGRGVVIKTVQRGGAC